MKVSKSGYRVYNIYIEDNTNTIIDIITIIVDYSSFHWSNNQIFASISVRKF